MRWVWAQNICMQTRLIFLRDPKTADCKFPGKTLQTAVTLRLKVGLGVRIRRWS